MSNEPQFFSGNDYPVKNCPGEVLPAISSMFKLHLKFKFSDNNFDLPDRTFHSLETTWRLASKDSPTDVKEIIPEFFCLPEILENIECFNFGARQSGQTVHHVKLPNWCKNSARLFTFIHRQALESSIVRKNLHNWIDLIYGFKQTGQPAIDAINVFHPATYYGFSCSEMIDPVEKMACETMIKTYGQMPKQLIKSVAHPANNPVIQYGFDKENSKQVLPNVKGLKWGIFTGSPQLSEPKICQIYEKYDPDFNYLVRLDNTNVIYGVSRKCCVMQGTEPDTMNLISWGDPDDIIKIKPICDTKTASRSLVHISRIDPVTACGTNTTSTQLWLGHKSGRITVYSCFSSNPNKYNKNRNSGFSKMSYNSAVRKILDRKPLESDVLGVTRDNSYQDINNMRWNDGIVLIRHTDEITSIVLSTEFKIVVSVGLDGLTTIWDLNKLQYIRTISQQSSLGASLAPLYLAAISPTLGDIVTVQSIEKKIKEHQPSSDGDEESFEVTESNIDDFVKVSMNLSGKSLMRLHTINARYVNHILLHEKILSICYSNIKEGTGVNVIGTGLEYGIIRLWSSWDLSLVREINVGVSDVISLTFSTYQHLVCLSKDNILQVWESNGLTGGPPKLPQLIFSRQSSLSNK